MSTTRAGTALLARSIRHESASQTWATTNAEMNPMNQNAAIDPSRTLR